MPRADGRHEGKRWPHEYSEGKRASSWWSLQCEIAGGRRDEAEERESAVCRRLSGGSGRQSKARVSRTVPGLGTEQWKRLALRVCRLRIVGLKKDGSGLALECISLFFLFYGYSNKTVSFSANRDFWPGFNRGSNIFKFLQASMKTVGIITY